MLTFLATFLVCLASVAAYTGVDLSVATTVADWQCLMTEHNVSYAIIRAYRSVGAVDSNSGNNVHYASQAGLKDLGVYMFPCMPTSPYSVNNGIACPSAEQQVLDTVKFLRENNVIIKRSSMKSPSLEEYPKDGVVVNRVWLDVEDESPAKYYDADPVKNQEFMAQVVAQLEAMHIPVGIYTTKTYWQNIMGNIEGYGSKYPLWYPRYDDVATLDFFVPFADFTEVKIKQTAGDSGFCSISQVDTDYREVESI